MLSIMLQCCLDWIRIKLKEVEWADEIRRNIPKGVVRDKHVTICIIGTFPEMHKSLLFIDKLESMHTVSSVVN